MQANLLLNKIVGIAVGLVALFVVLLYSTPLDNLIVALNGVFAGTMAAILVAYFTLLRKAILGVHPYDRVRQMTLGFFLCWLAYCVVVLASIYTRASGLDANSTVMTAGSRYLAIIAAVLQVTAPDFGLGLFHGRDRKILTAGVLSGLAVAAIAILAQEHSVLSR